MPDLAAADLGPGLEAVVACGLGLLGLAGTQRPRAAMGGALGLCAAGALVAFVVLVSGAPAARIAVPVGLPGLGMVLTLDGLSGFFLLLVLLVGAAATGAALAMPAAAIGLPPLLGAMVLTLIAGDGFALLLGFGSASVAAFALMLAGAAEPAARRAAARHRGMAALAAACLIPAVALLASAQPWGIDLGFAAIRAHPPEGWRAALVLLLAIAGTAGQGGLPPGAAPAAGAMATLALYVLLRIAFDLAGPAQPAWWGVPLIALGAAGAAFGGLRAARGADIRSLLGSAAMAHLGLIAVGIGVALAARAADLTTLAALALGGALLHATALALATTLLSVAAGAVGQEAGTRLLSRLGGLIRVMPVTTLAVLAGAATLAALPPGAGFAGVWMLLQAVLAAPRIGGLSLQILIAVTAALMALAVALSAAAMVRLVGVGFLGRPRTPRAAAAQEPAAAVRAAMLALAGAGLLVGLFPGGMLALARPALRLAVGASLAGRSTGFAIAPQADAPGYAAPGVALLLVLALALAWLLARTRAVGGHRTAPAWDGGVAPPPVWLPFGEPLTQASGAGFAPDMGGRDPAARWLRHRARHLRRALAHVAARLPRPSVRGRLAAMFCALVLLLLLAVAIMAPP